MKKWIIGSLVGAIIIFAWQALSWMVLDLHKGAEKYHPEQDKIIGMLSSSISEDGMYMLPTVPPGTDHKTAEELMKNMVGKPWAMVMYRKSFDGDMTTPIIRGFIIDLALVILLIAILTKGALPQFAGIVTGSLAVGLFSFLWGPYTGYNWSQLTWAAIQGHLIDSIIAWGLCGLWLGWWLRR